MPRGYAGKVVSSKEATAAWRLRNPDKVLMGNRKKRVRVYEPEKAKVMREARLKKEGYREKLNSQGRTRRAEINTFLRDYKLLIGCKDCGYHAHHAALEFHHEGSDKTLNLSFAKSLSQAKSEMAKCIVLCSNCHRVRHWNELHGCKPDIFAATYEPVE